jgi:hypothetical protein
MVALDESKVWQQLTTEGKEDVVALLDTARSRLPGGVTAYLIYLVPGPWDRLE